MQPVTIIAETSSNAGGNLRRAEEFIKAFAPAADIIKFQLTRVKHLRPDDPQYDWFRQAEWSPGGARDLTVLCADHHAQALFTVYHTDDVAELADITRWPHLPAIKIGSGESHQGNLAQAVLAAPFERIYVSEGIRPIHQNYRTDERVRVLGCVSRYPAPAGIVSDRWKTGQYQGWSDHSIGMNECMLAVHYGAEIIEKHVQHPLQSRPPQPWEATAEELLAFREWTRQDPERFLGRWQHTPATVGVGSIHR